MPKIHKSFQNGYNIILFMQQISLYRNARFSREFCTKRTFPGKTGHFFHFSLFFVFAAVAGRGDSQRLFEDLCKIIHVQNAHFLGHGGNGVVVLYQQLAARLTRWVLI